MADAAKRKTIVVEQIGSPIRRPGIQRATLIGLGLNKMHKTVVVECIDYTRDALYGKYVKQRARFKAHDETNQYKVGDEVEIQEHRPISREKRFIVVRLVKKFVEE